MCANIITGSSVKIPRFIAPGLHAIFFLSPVCTSHEEWDRDYSKTSAQSVRAYTPCMPYTHPRWQNSVPGLAYPKRTWHQPRRHASIMFIRRPATVTLTVCMMGPVVPPIPVHPSVVPIRSTVGSVAATVDMRSRHNRWMRHRQAWITGDPAGAAKRCWDGERWMPEWLKATRNPCGWYHIRWADHRLTNLFENWLSPTSAHMPPCERTTHMREMSDIAAIQLTLSCQGVQHVLVRTVRQHYDKISLKVKCQTVATILVKKLTKEIEGTHENQLCYKSSRFGSIGRHAPFYHTQWVHTCIYT